MKESWADAYKSVYEAAKPDYLDFDKDGNKEESMKKALSDKKKGKKGMKEDAECAHNKKGEDCPKHGKEDCTMKEGVHPQYKKEEVEVAEADSLAAMAARREKRLAAQRKKMGTSSTGQDFGHDYGISSAERKKRQQAEFDKFVGRGKKTTKESVQFSEAELARIQEIVNTWSD